MKYSVKSKSFTLIEILIVVTIISVLATTTLATFYGYANVRSTDREVAYIVSDINLARNKALSNAYDDNGTPAMTDDSAYWGVKFNCTSPEYSYELGYFSSGYTFYTKQKKFLPKDFTCSTNQTLRFTRGTGILQNPGDPANGRTTTTIKYQTKNSRSIRTYLNGKVEITTP